MTDALDPADRRAYRRRGAPLGVYGLIQAIVGVAGALDHSLLTTSSAVQALNGPVATAWLLVSGFGGLLVVAGVLWPRPDLEVAGIVMLMAFAALNAIAIVVNRGPVGGGLTASSILLVGFVLYLRLGDIVGGARPERRRENLGHASRGARS